MILLSRTWEKGVHSEAKAYIGVCGIHDYKTFWEAMSAAKIKAEALGGTRINQGESFALAVMVKQQSVKGVKFTWYDTGTVEALSHANQVFGTDDDPNILPKAQEHIWFCNGRVVKFSTDRDFIAQRVARAKASLGGYVPEIEGSSKNF